MRLAALLLAACAALPAAAAEPPLALPGAAELRAEETVATGSARIALGPWRADDWQVRRAEGTLRRQAWRTEWDGLTTDALAAALRDALAGAGYELLFDCRTDGCGGFDFRYALTALPEPAMHVDLGDFAYLAARRGAGDTAEHMALMISRRDAYGYVEITHVGAGPEAGTPQIAKSTRTDPAAATADSSSVADRLRDSGSAVLGDLRFSSGSTDLDAGDYASLDALAGWLAAHPEARVALVGHTDFSGSLAVNMDISERRARSVRERLVAAHDIAADRLEAHGIGYLAPLASNDSPEGRARNRRVEAVVILP